ncbi:unnamed protein product [Mycena citricolor]|uniref:Uncharacterized protein n=1 Tax=Mycena citricolor TaxID=2018698 RepID=A0AAD2H5H2_9AGAR|nr:unnamed protein product [Mycena citricolor]
MTSTTTTTTTTTARGYTHAPTIRLVAPTPDASAYTDMSSSFSSSSVGPARKKSLHGLFSAATVAPSTGTGGDFSDIVRRVGASSSGRGWEVHVDASEGTIRSGTARAAQAANEGEGMVLLKKKVKARGRVDAVFGDVTNLTRPASPAVEGIKEKEKEGKEKWWNLTARGRKDTTVKEGGVLSFVRRGKSPGPSRASSPFLEPAPQAPVSQNAFQMHLPGEPDCTVDMVEVPSLRGHGVQKDLPPTPVFPTAKRFNSLGASSSLAPQPRPDYQRSVSAGSAALLAQAAVPHPQYAHLPGAAAPYATMTRAAVYEAPPRSASALGIYDAAPREKKSSATAALVSSGILLGAPARAPAPGLLAVPKDKDKEGSFALRAMRSMAKLGGKDGENDLPKKKLKVKEKKKEDKKVKEAKRAPKSSGSSFEIGQLGTSPVQRKRSILGLGLGKSATVSKSAGLGIGLGLPSALSLGRSTSTGGKASTASSVFVPPSTNPNRVSAESHLSAESRVSADSLHPDDAHRRVSTNSSVRPLSVLSSSSSGGSRVSSSSSIRWAEEVVDRVKKTAGKRTGSVRSRDSQHSAEGRKRTPLSDVFPGMSSRRSSSSAASSIAPPPPMLMVEEATTDGHGHGDDDEELDDSASENDFEIVSATPVKRAIRPISDEMLLGQTKHRTRAVSTDPDGSALTLLDAASNDLAQLLTTMQLDSTPSPARSMMSPPKEWQESPVKAKGLRASEGSVSSLRPYGARLGQQIAPWPKEATPPSVGKKISPASFRRTHRRTETPPSPERDPGPILQPLRIRPSRINVFPAKPVSVISSASSDDELRAEIEARAPSALTFGSRSSSSSLEMVQRLPTVFHRGHVRNRSSLLSDTAPPAGMPLARETRRVLGMTGTMGGSDVSGYTDADAEDPDSDIPGELQVLLSSSPIEETMTLPSPGLPPTLPLPASPIIPSFNVELVDDNEDEDTKQSFDFTGELQKLNESGGSDRLSFVEQLENAFKTPAKVDLRGLLTMPSPPPPVPPLPVVQPVATEEDACMDLDQYPSPIVELGEPTVLQGSDSLASDDSLFVPLQISFGGDIEQEMTLSDIIPPPAHVESHSLSAFMEEEESVLKSILAHAAEISPAKSVANRFSMMTMSRPPSGVSFTGLDSFEEVRRGFEGHANRPAFFPPPAASSSFAANRRHLKQDSVFSIASVSSYGHVTNPGVHDPFDYGLAMPSLRERPSSEDLSVSMSINVDDTFSFLDRGHRRKRVASDASSFYFPVPAAQARPYGHRRRESNLSVSSQQGGPPVSFYNYNRTHQRMMSDNDTSTSGSSLAHHYAVNGANGGRAAWARHRPDPSVDSVMSDYSVSRLGRPGVGDKMFEQQMEFSSSALEPISASPRSGSFVFDSIMDGGRQSIEEEDSLFDKTGRRTSISEDSVFGYDDRHPPNGHLLPPHQFRPLSLYSLHNGGDKSPRDDDTMITMLGGGHARRSSIGSAFEASPCVRVEKRKHAEAIGPNKARIISQPSISSTKFGDERMIRAQQGLLVRQSLEENALIASGEDNSLVYSTVPVFTRPSPGSRSRSSTITTASSSSGAETPPLSSASLSDDGGAPPPRFDGAITCLCYETIEEEWAASPAPTSSPTANLGVAVVDSDTATFEFEEGMTTTWDDERGIVALRKYDALRHEAEVEVIESKRVWSDTPFSVFALQSFRPPKSAHSMQALLQHSVQTYGPLPSELGPRRVRSRTQSRASPYHVPMSPEIKTGSISARPTPEELNRGFALQAVEMNVASSPLTAAALKKPAARPRVASAARRSALGWAKRSTEQKENAVANTSSGSAMSFLTSPNLNESLRLSRPRPKGRPMSARPGNTPASRRVNVI